MRFLRTKDYTQQIQLSDLDQLLDGNNEILYSAEAAAQAELTSYLIQRYQTNKVFAPTLDFNTSTIYFGKNLINYTELDYDSGSTYVTSQRVNYSDNIYSANTSTTGGTFINAQWDLITANETLYYAALPNQEYNPKTTYKIGDTVWYNDLNYVCVVGDNLGFYPDTNTSLWSTNGVEYSFSNVMPDNTAYWVKADNRPAQIVLYMIDCTLYHLHTRLATRLVPETRLIRYDGGSSHQTGGVIGWLKKVSKGLINAELPEIVPPQGRSIRWGYSTQSIDNKY